MKDYLFSPTFLSGAGAILKAILILILAFIVAAIIKSLVIKLLIKTKAGVLLDKIRSEGSSAEDPIQLIGKFFYLIVFLLFVPGILSSLGMDSVSAPILGILNTIWGFIPNVVAAAIILIIGFLVAKLVRQLLVPVFDRLNVNRLQEKAGIETTETGKLSSTLAYIVYVLILIPVIITALHALNIRAISDPAISMLNLIFSFIPHILVALIIIIIGCMIGKFGGQIVERMIAAAGLDGKLSQFISEKDCAKNFCLSKAVGITVRTIIVIFFAVESFSVLKLQVLTNIGATIIRYMPSVLAAILILAVCLFAASAAEKALNKRHAVYALVAKTAIWVIGVFMALSQMGIASKIVTSAFVLILAAVAVAFAIAFGIGGKDFAAHALKKLEEQTSAEKKD